MGLLTDGPGVLSWRGQAAFSRRVAVSMSSILDRKPTKPKPADVSAGSFAGGLFTSSSPETRR